MVPAIIGALSNPNDPSRPSQSGTVTVNRIGGCAAVGSFAFSFFSIFAFLRALRSKNAFQVSLGSWPEPGITGRKFAGTSSGKEDVDRFCG